jgi:hypothetical protein
MSHLPSLVVMAVALFESAGCASRHDTGEALIAGGTIVAVTTAAVATHTTCMQSGCSGQTSRHAKEAAAGVAAGVVLAAAGAALASEPAGDSALPKPARAAPKSGNWHLVRKADEGEEPPAYYIEE